MANRKTGKNIKDFEAAMQTLETLVQEMAQDNLELDTALKKFEEGIVLAKACQKKLDEAELQVKKLIEE